MATKKHVSSWEQVARLEARTEQLASIVVELVEALAPLRQVRAERGSPRKR